MLWAVSCRNILFNLLKNTLPSVSLSPIFVILRRHTVILILDYSHSLFNLLFFELQYSQKEDKYEEEIKVLTDKLKEVRCLLSNIWHGFCCFPLVWTVLLDLIEGWHVHAVCIAGWDPCRVCREICGQAGEDHRWFGRYSTLTCCVFRWHQ